MLEIGVIFLTLGAIFYQTFHLSFVLIIAISIAVFVISSLLLRSKKGLIFALLMATLIILGALLLWRVDEKIPENFFGYHVLDAKVLTVDKRLERSLVVVKVKDSDQKVQLNIRGDSNLLPKDKLQIEGKVERPQSFLTDNGRIFDYDQYLSAKGIVAIINNPIISKIEPGGFGPSRVATIARYKIAALLAAGISFPVDGIIGGMLVGYQGGLPQTVQDLFRQTGVLHVLVLSGYNITLLAGFLAFLLRALGKRTQLTITIMAIILLVLISGAGVASVRAGIMGSIALTAGLTIRKYNPLRALVLAYLIFFILEPKIIFIDPGFHLSFLATLFMVLVLSRVKKIFAFVPEIKQINFQEIIILSFCVPIFMLPYLIYFAGYFPLVSPLANIVLALLTPILMLSGIIFLLLSFLPPVSLSLGILISWLGLILIKVLTQLATWPIWHLPSIAGGWIILFYLILISMILRKEIREHLKIYFKALS